MKVTLFSLCFLLLSNVFSAELLTWSSKNNHSFNGSFVSKNADTIILKGSDGQTVTVPINALDEKSLLQLEAEYATALKNAPVYTFENVHYRYAIYPRADWLHLEFLRAGQPLNPQPYIFRLSLVEKVGNSLVHYKITGMEGEPQVNGNEVEVYLTTDKGITLRLFASKGTSKDFDFHFATAASDRSQANLSLSNTLRFEGLLTYDMDSQLYKGPFSESGLSFQQLPAALDDYSIKYIKGKHTTKVGYHEKQNGTQSGQKIVITHPNDPVLTIEKTGDVGSLAISFYGSKAVIEGFSLKFHAIRNEILETDPFTVSVK
ncbi:hypothetical protein P3T73_03640 [Kiritimatiellota bacterium B12222]|nr:hypothetical protein P3T73_03640 [Kiritimatiellota bacterium B12222]